MFSQTLVRYEILAGNFMFGRADHEPTDRGLEEAVARADSLAATGAVRAQVMAVYADETREPVYDTYFPDRRPVPPARPLFPDGTPKLKRPSGLAER